MSARFASSLAAALALLATTASAQADAIGVASYGRLLRANPGHYPVVVATADGDSATVYEETNADREHRRLPNGVLLTVIGDGETPAGRTMLAVATPEDGFIGWVMADETAPPPPPPREVWARHLVVGADAGVAVPGDAARGTIALIGGLRHGALYAQLRAGLESGGGPESGYYWDTFSNGGRACRNSANGQFADAFRCSPVFGVASAEAGLRLPSDRFPARLGAGYRLGSEGGLFGALSVPVYLLPGGMVAVRVEAGRSHAVMTVALVSGR